MAWLGTDWPKTEITKKILGALLCGDCHSPKKQVFFYEAIIAYIVKIYLVLGFVIILYKNDICLLLY
jgi:hypothetical protein